jgi:MFS family permease
MFVTALALIDRQILVLLVEPIKQDLQISDTRMSILMGFAFVMFYAILGIPIARLADVKSRRLIIGCGIAFWSIMTASCGLAHNYWQLFLARMGVGAGEACNGPATFSIVGDSFPPEKLAKASGVISSGFYLGSGAALIVGGAIIEAATNMPNIVIPIIGEIRPWQTTFLIVGLPGVLVACLMATVHEPERRGLIILKDENGKPLKRKSLPLKVIMQWLRDDRKTYLPIYGGMALRAMSSIGATAWLPTFFMRTYGWNAAEVGMAMGLVLLIIAPAGLIAGGILAEWLAKKGHPDANIRVVLLSSIASVPVAILYPLMPSPLLALALYAMNTFLLSASPGPQNAALVIVTPNQMRAQASALYFFLFNLVGMGLGPLLVALFTDYLFDSEAALRYSLSLQFAILGPLTAIVIWTGLRPYRESVIRAKARE